MFRKLFLTLAAGMLSILMLSSCQNEEKKLKDAEMIQQKLDQFTKTEIKYDESLLDEKQKKVVENIYKAAQVMDKLFLRQVYYKNTEIKNRLQNMSSESAQLTLEYFNIMFGPFDRLDHNKPFYGDYKKPEGANYYPLDMSKEEFNKWIEDHPEDEEAFTSEFTMIRRQEEDVLQAIPYSEFFKEDLSKAAGYLREAAKYAENQSLKKYLELRADAFESNDYYKSDMAWMDLEDHTIEVVIGPYEVYEDQLFNYKAAFECFLTLVDPEETRKVEKFESYLTDMEKNLPIPDKHKNFDRGSESPIVVAQEVFSAGDTKAGVQTLAFNLPNDERVRQAKGSKKVMLKNIHEAKFDKILKPIAREVMSEENLPHVTFEGFFNHTLMHEMSHGIGPGYITVDGEETEVKKELKDTYSTIEECKADILGMWNNLFMIKKGVYPKEFEKQIWSTFLAGTFRSIRFGINEAHGGGNAIIYNYLLENGAYNYDKETQKVSVNYDKIQSVLKDLANKVLMIQAKGDYRGAKDLIDKYAVESESIKTIRGKLTGLPVDIKPVFQIEKEME